MYSFDLEETLRTKGLSRQAAADMASVNIRTVFRWIKGTTPIPAGSAELLALKTSFLPDVEISGEQVPSE